MFLDDAELKTESWRLRHSHAAIQTLGAWRWIGVQRHALKILDICRHGPVIDFGGADGPLGLGSVVVDLKAAYRTLDEVPGHAAAVFTSHTLEHSEDLYGTINAIADKLVPRGWLICHVPAWTCTRWQAGSYANANQETPHRHTFALIGDDVEADNLTCIDSVLSERFELSVCEHCGDNSLMLIGRKRD